MNNFVYIHPDGWKICGTYGQCLALLVSNGNKGEVSPIE